MKGLLVYVMILSSVIILLLSSVHIVLSSFSSQELSVVVDDLESSLSASSLPPISWDTKLYLREENKRRIKRQEEGGLDDESKTLSEGVCDFGAEGGLVTCSWYVPTDSHPLVRWKVGSGTTSYWLGGPKVDKTTGENTGKCMHVCRCIYVYVSVYM